jgi:hypothetical protein
MAVLIAGAADRRSGKVCPSSPLKYAESPFGPYENKRFRMGFYHENEYFNGLLDLTW